MRFGCEDGASSAKIALTNATALAVLAAVGLIRAFLLLLADGGLVMVICTQCFHDINTTIDSPTIHHLVKLKWMRYYLSKIIENTSVRQPSFQLHLPYVHVSLFEFNCA